MSTYLSVTTARAWLSYIDSSLYCDADLESGPGVNETWIQSDLDAIEAIINGYLARRYTTPATGAASLDLLRAITEVLLLEKAYTRAPNVETPEDVKDNANAGRMQLRDVAKGVLTLSDAALTTTAKESRFEFTSNTPIFNKSTSQGFF